MNQGFNENQSIHSYRQLFRTLSPPDQDSLNGKYLAHFIGPSWLRTFAPFSLSILKFHGWCGKEFFQGLEGINIFNCNQGLCQYYRFYLRSKPSLIDSRLSIVVNYESGCPFPWPLIIDEIRSINSQTMLGMTLIKTKILNYLAFPFLLLKWDDEQILR